MQTEFVFAGFGGQGVMFAGQLLAYAAMDSGLEVTWIPSYGPEMRGGTANCTVIISQHPIGAPVVREPAVVVAFNAPSLHKYEPTVKTGGLLVWNSSIITESITRADVIPLSVPASEIADQIGSLKMMNMVMLGAVLGMRPVIPLEVVIEALKAHTGGKRKELLPLNERALFAGAQFAMKALETAK